MNVNNYFGCVSLRISRREAKRHGIKVPRLDVWTTSAFGKQYYKVKVGEACLGMDKGTMVFQGTAANKYHAKAQAIDILIARALTLAGKDPDKLMYTETTIRKLTHPK